MMMETGSQNINSKKIVQLAVEKYLTSRDFNGLPIRVLNQQFEDETTVKEVLRTAIETELLNIVLGDRHPNPHVMALPPESIEEQISKFDHDLFQQACIYPSKKVLLEKVHPSDYAGRPFTLELALGEASLTPRFFDLSVLERYRNDPRYVYEVSDCSGRISIHSGPDEPSTLRDHDQVLLDSFGFGHNKEVTHRVVVAYLGYLTRLSPEHQQIWTANLLGGEHYVHPAYYAATLGHWPEEVGVFEAVISEMHCICEICSLMGKPSLFREDFQEKSPPKNFAFLLRPTVKEFHDFILTLEKILIHNINKDFFRGDIPLEEDFPRDDGKIEVRQRGTIQLLESWLSTYYRSESPDALTDLMKIPRKIRRLRQRPAHSLDDDLFDYKLFEQQRALIGEVYTFLNVIRRVFSRHPRANGYEAPDYLEKEKIWNF